MKKQQRKNQAKKGKEKLFDNLKASGPSGQTLFRWNKRSRGRPGGCKEFCVYLLKSLKDNNYYIGQTNNVEKRLEMHNQGKVRSTKSRTPFILIGFEKYLSRNEARYREYKLKNKPSIKRKFISKLVNINEKEQG